MPTLPSIESYQRALWLYRRSTARNHTRFYRLTAKGGFNPDQPRVPAGSPEGGQWAGGEGSGQSRQPGIGDNGGPALDLPESPKDPPKDQASKTQAA